MTLRHSINSSALACYIAIQASACSFVFEDDSPQDYHESIYFWPDSHDYYFSQCQSGTYYSYCGRRYDNERSDYAWKPNCESASCSKLGVIVHNLIQRDLGTQATIWVEASRNPDFYGDLTSMIKISPFDASGPQSTSREELYLEPGEYFVRAYLSNKLEQTIPSALKGMEPSGSRDDVFGAISPSQHVIISKYNQPDTVHLNLNQLFEDPGNKANSEAKLRLNISVDDTFSIPANRNIIIQLLGEPDVDLLPTEQFYISSNDLLVSSHVGQSQFLSPNLNDGEYYLFIFLDEDGDDFYDSGELAYFHNTESQPSIVRISKNTYRSLEVNLSLYPRLP